MSGYLQRLARSVVERGDSVHPRTGSIFSPRQEETRAPLQGLGEVEHVTPAHQRPESRATPSELDEAEPFRRVTQRSEHTPLLPRSAASDTRSTAHTPPAFPVPLRHGGEPVVSGDAPSWEPPKIPFTDATEVHVTAPVTRDANDAFRALMKPASVSDVVTRSAQPRNMAVQPNAPRGGRQPDDIQIHIGRIEVIAVPPPAPRAPKAPDRSPSLDAYLSRRDGRAR
jgi:hypothetical protein